MHFSATPTLSFESYWREGFPTQFIFPPGKVAASLGHISMKGSTISHIKGMVFQMDQSNK